MNRPLLVVDGDSFAHRAYHALPKSIRRTGNRGGGVIVGFANLLLRLYDSEQPRAVLVGWDTLGVPTFRQRLFPSYQSGRQFDEELIDQLEVLPQLVTAVGFANAKASGYEADDFLAAEVADEERRFGKVLVASGDPDAFQLASAATIILHPVKGGEIARIGPSEVRNRYGSSLARCRISSLCEATHRTSCPVRAASVRRAQRPCFNDTARLSRSLRMAVSPSRQTR